MAHKQLTDEERYQIEALKREGFNQSEIARSLNRNRSKQTVLPRSLTKHYGALPIQTGDHYELHPTTYPGAVAAVD